MIIEWQITGKIRFTAVFECSNQNENEWWLASETEFDGVDTKIAEKGTVSRLQQQVPEKEF